MKNELMVFEEQEVLGKAFTIYGDNENPLFLAKDVAVWIDYGFSDKEAGIRKVSQMVSTVDDEEKLMAKIKSSDMKQARDMLFLTEDGLYEVLMQSRKPIAKQFKKEIKKILKTIRKTVKTLESIDFKGNINGLAYIKNNEIMTTSIKIAEATGKEHSKILRDIDDELLKIDEAKIGDISDMKNEITYIDSMNRVQKSYEINEQLTLMILARYSAEFRYKITKAFLDMRSTLIKMHQARALEQVLPQDNRLRQFVYVIGDPVKNICKIGVAQNVNKRLKQLQTGNGTELEILWVSNVCSNAYEIEKIAHNNFAENKILNEWFLVSVCDIVEFLELQEYKLRSEFNNKIRLLKK